MQSKYNTYNTYNKTFIGRTFQINNKCTNIKILQCSNSMPPKFQSSGHDNSISMNRNIYYNKAGKGSYGTAASCYTHYLKSKAIGKSMRGYVNKKIPIKQCFGKINYNDTKRAMQKARSRGYVKPSKCQL